MKYKFQVEKKSFDIEIANSTTFHSATDIKIDKDQKKIMLGEQSNGEVRSLFVDDRLYQFEIVKNSEGYPEGIYVNGTYYSASLQKIDNLFYYKEKEVKAAQSGLVRSFIPGNIKKIFFNAEDKVKEGDIILIHEAMKMENEIRAPKSGKIVRIGVTEGENILANHLLFEIE